MFDYGVSFFLKESRRFFVFSALLSALGFVWELTQVFLLLNFLGVQASGLIVALFYLSIYFFNGVPVFGGFGFGEVGAFVSGSFLGASPELSLSLALLLRSRQLVALFVGGAVFILHELKELRGNHWFSNGKQTAGS